MSTMSIPAFHVSDQTIVDGKGIVAIASRQDSMHTGEFEIAVKVQFNPAGGDQYPTGTVFIRADLNDSLKGTFKSTSIELVNSYGRANGTFFITGRCADDAERNPQGCRFWVVIANNNNPTHRGTADIAGFAIHDHNGARVAYGMGPVKGDFNGKAEF